MAAYNHLEAIGAIVNDLFKVPNGTTINKQIHASASAKMLQRIGGVNYNIYRDLFTSLADSDAYDAIAEKEFYSQSPSERVLMQCQRAEANLYIYYLIPKLKKLQNNDVAFEKINLGKGGLDMAELDKIKNKRDEFLDDAYDILDSIDFNMGDYGVNQTSTITIMLTDNRENVYDIEEEE